MTPLQYKVCRQVIKLLNTVYIHTKAGLKDSLPTAVITERDGTFSEIIDVRTPAEFKLDHIPGAINLPVLSDEERVTIGTLHATDKFEARKRGAALISRKISDHIEEYLFSKSKDYSPLIYCWRGGQRSNSFGIVLSQIGFKTCVLHGGYQKYRSRVREELKTLPDQFQYRVISGMTGSGKTHILDALSDRGEQVLDLEALAKHKGSILGLWHKETQPSQKFWESCLLHELQKFTPDRPVWMESESRKIGSVFIPDRLFENLRAAPRYCITLPLEERVKHIINAYPHWIEEPDNLKDILEILGRNAVGKKTLDVWQGLIDKQQWEEFVSHILVNHYDPTYKYSQKKNNISGLEIEEIQIPDLNESTVQALVTSLIKKGCQNNENQTEISAHS